MLSTVCVCVWGGGGGGGEGDHEYHGGFLSTMGVFSTVGGYHDKMLGIL